MALRVLGRHAVRAVSAASPIATRYQTRSFAKAKKNKDSKSRASVPTAVLADNNGEEDDEEEEDGLVDDEEDGGAAKAVRKATKNMKGAVVNFTRTLRQMRPGRADAGIFDELHVQAYGQHVPMAQLAQVSVVSSHALSVSVYDPSLLPDVKKAIEGTNPVYSVREDASGLEISFPKMSKETRAELLKATKKQAEKARQHVRRVRQDAMNHAKKLKETVSEDAMEAQKERIQKVTDGAIAEIAKILEAKETDLSTV
uniref:Ribosome recycling factor domain-containing protein n=1 Tax=Hyaloperonospora arabidopsidis (strain Emoy2) TaxID=559515 RepID=M4BNY4_HYAAE